LVDSIRYEVKLGNWKSSPDDLGGAGRNYYCPEAPALIPAPRGRLAFCFHLPTVYTISSILDMIGIKQVVAA
jgi:hypothetical protein